MRQTPSPDERLKLLIKQAAILLRRMDGVSILRNSVLERAKKHGDIDANWLCPAMEVLDDYECRTLEWFGDRVEVAGGEP